MFAVLMSAATRVHVALFFFSGLLESLNTPARDPKQPRAFYPDRRSQARTRMPSCPATTA